MNKDKILRMFVIPQICQPQPKEGSFKDMIINLKDDATICLLRIVTNYFISFGLAATSNLFENEINTYLEAAAMIYGHSMALVNGTDFLLRAKIRGFNQYRKK